MLVNLLIKNYVLIRNLEIDFSEGYSVITGETGAGKSIILGALNLIMGQRADSGAVLDSGQKCIVEATFEVENYGLKGFFETEELDYEPLTFLRREITANGKSRAFVNDTPVNLATLKKLSLHLIDIHSQHQNLSLDDGDFQLSVLDGFAGNEKELGAYSKLYTTFLKLRKELSETKAQAEKATSDLDYFQFQFDQLDQANLVEDEQSKLDEEFKTQSHAEEIKSVLYSVEGTLSGDDSSVVSKLSELRTALAATGSFHAASAELEERINSCLIELKDIASEAEIAAVDIEFDPERLEFINQRLNTIYELQQKHHVDSVADLIAYKEELQEKLDNITGFDDQIAKLELELSKLSEELAVLAAKIHKKREKAAPILQKQAIALLAKLGMPNAQFQSEIKTLDDFQASGKDKVSFLFSANAGGVLSSLTKVASGGEKSRLMLVIKRLLSEQKKMPSIIFDEIDTGISGAIASQMGSIMKEMGESMQVISISHLPQVAAKGEHHYRVVKTEGKGTTHTTIEKLNEETRIEELAKMLGAGKVTEANLKNALELANH